MRAGRDQRWPDLPAASVTSQGGTRRRSSSKKFWMSAGLDS